MRQLHFLGIGCLHSTSYIHLSPEKALLTAAGISSKPFALPSGALYCLLYMVNRPNCSPGGSRACCIYLDLKHLIILAEQVTSPLGIGS
jgi:hypothetical protein